MHGTVTAFDDEAGVGIVTAEDGTEHPFHCTQIADGTRRIAVGAAVTFALIAKLGRWEAAAVAER
jgi:cold shock CspA family protein